MTFFSLEDGVAYYGSGYSNIPNSYVISTNLDGDLLFSIDGSIFRTVPAAAFTLPVHIRWAVDPALSTSVITVNEVIRHADTSVPQSWDYSATGTHVVTLTGVSAGTTFDEVKIYGELGTPIGSV